MKTKLKQPVMVTLATRRLANPLLCFLTFAPLTIADVGQALPGAA
jgi:hypothetical protein